MTDNQLITLLEGLFDRKLKPYFEKVDERFEKMDARLDKIEARLHGMDVRLAGMDARLAGMDARLDKMDARLDEIDEHLRQHDDKFEILEIKVTLTNKKLKELSLEVKVSEHSIRKDIHYLQDTQDTVVAVLEARNILPQARVN